MSDRLAIPPPKVQGYEYIRLIAQGATSDVFQYRQLLPSRMVALKVFTMWESPAVLAEANTMAAISTHPSIVTVYIAGTTDDGRDYIAMEYCARPNLELRLRRERFSANEALSIGVQLSGALETAHRAGIRHGDIKPSNVLVTDFGRPALTDFGIAGVVEESELIGMSIPWAPPEFFGPTPRASLLSDVYSLGATVFSLLAGHAPYVPTGLSAEDLARRIAEATAPPRLPRDDVEPELIRVLRKAMATDPAERFSSAFEFGQAMQSVQSAAGDSVTPMDVQTEASESADALDLDWTTTVIGPRTVLAVVPSVDRQVVPAEAMEGTFVTPVISIRPDEIDLAPRPLTPSDSPYELVVDELATQRPFAPQIDHTILFGRAGGYVGRGAVPERE